jgi:hypothetical protein
MAPRTPLLHPDSYFGSKRASLLRASVVVFLVALVLTGSFLAMGAVFADRMDGTIEVDNPARPSDWVCEEHGDDPDSAFSAGCDEPKTYEKRMGDVLVEAFTDRVDTLFFGTFLAWMFVAVVLYVLAKIVGGSGGFVETLAVAGWGMAPSVVGSVLAVVAVYFAVRSVEFGSDPETVARQVRQLADGGVGPASHLVSVGVAAWQGYVWAYGLSHVHDLSIRAAAGVAGLVAVGSLLL